MVVVCFFWPPAPPHPTPHAVDRLPFFFFLTLRCFPPIFFLYIAFVLAFAFFYHRAKTRKEKRAPPLSVRERGRAAKKSECLSLSLDTPTFLCANFCLFRSYLHYVHIAQEETHFFWRGDSLVVFS
jgi:hypothetical protein